MKKGKKWVRGVNITVSPDAHKKLREKSVLSYISIRDLIDIHIGTITQ